MKKYLVILLCLVGIFSFAQKPDNPELFREEIESFNKIDKENKPKKEGIVFTGSSSIRGWRSLKNDFPEKNVINRGFGGSRIGDAIFYFEEVIGRYKPKQVVFYSGENDIAAGKKAEAALAQFQKFHKKFTEELPNSKLLYISMKPSPARMNFFPEMQKANALIKEYISKHQDVEYLDITEEMLKGDIPKKDIYLDDDIHMNEKGYDIWQKAITPHLL